MKKNKILLKKIKGENIKKNYLRKELFVKNFQLIYTKKKKLFSKTLFSKNIYFRKIIFKNIPKNM